MTSIIPTREAPTIPSELVEDFTPLLLSTRGHSLCAGCGEPAAVRAAAELMTEMGLGDHAIGVVGIGCYTGFASAFDVDTVGSLHGRAPSLATGIKRMKPDTFVFTLQGDGDMVNEGLQEIIHAAARGENFTAILLNNGVFGETGGQMTATTVLGQRTKNTLEGRDPKKHGYPVPIGDLIAGLDGASYVARGAVNNVGNVARVRRMFGRAFEHQLAGHGFSFVEVLTMCPTGWFIETGEAPDYLQDTLADTFELGVLKDTHDDKTGKAA